MTRRRASSALGSEPQDVFRWLCRKSTAKTWINYWWGRERTLSTEERHFWLSISFGGVLTICFQEKYHLFHLDEESIKSGQFQNPRITQSFISEKSTCQRIWRMLFVIHLYPDNQYVCEFCYRERTVGKDLEQNYCSLSFHSSRSKLSVNGRRCIPLNEASNRLKILSSKYLQSFWIYYKLTPQISGKRGPYSLQATWIVILWLLLWIEFLILNRHFGLIWQYRWPQAVQY